jgi:hypothetical protein
VIYKGPKETSEVASFLNMAKYFLGFVLFLTHFGSPALLAQEKIPNDPYYKYQFSFHNPGGKIRINTRSYKPSMEEFGAEKGIDLNIEKAWPGLDRRRGFRRFPSRSFIRTVPPKWSALGNHNWEQECSRRPLR